MTNAGKYNHKIRIYQTVIVEDSAGFQQEQKEVTVLTPYASVKTTKGMTIIRNNSDFEKALTNFTIRYPKNVEINRDMLIDFRGKTYTIQYLNNVDEACIELEIQAKEVTH
jgi:SPP1 family predicted phage head-tail adaptor